MQQTTAGALFWPTSTSHLAYPSLQTDARCDVAIIGAGVIGGMAAAALTQSGIDTILLDAGQVAGGSTAASTALLLYELDVSLNDLSKIIGHDRAARSYRIGLRALSELEAIAAELGAGCGFERKKSLYIASSEQDVAALREEYAARRQLGIDVEYLDPSDIDQRFSFRRAGAILSHDAAQVNPVAFTRLLIERSARRGLRVLEKSPVARWIPHSDGVEIFLVNRCRIVARRVIIATGYTSGFAQSQSIGQTHNTYAAISVPVEDFPGWPQRCLIWETARPYFYFRTTADGRVLIGGEDDEHPFPPSPAQISHKAETLQTKFAQMFPAIPFKCERAWAGVFKTTADGLPYIGERPGFANAYFALGYGGNGMTFAPIAARIIRDLCAGHTHLDAELFRFNR